MGTLYRGFISIFLLTVSLSLFASLNSNQSLRIPHLIDSQDLNAQSDQHPIVLAGRPSHDVSNIGNSTQQGLGSFASLDSSESHHIPPLIDSQDLNAQSDQHPIVLAGRPSHDVSNIGNATQQGLGSFAIPRSLLAKQDLNEIYHNPDWQDSQNLHEQSDQHRTAADQAVLHSANNNNSEQLSHDQFNQSNHVASSDTQPLQNVTVRSYANLADADQNADKNVISVTTKVCCDWCCW